MSSPPRVLALLMLAACGPGEPARPVFPLGDEPLPPPSETCFRERGEVDGQPYERQLRIKTDPAAGRVTRVVTLRGAPAADAVRTVMDIESERFTSVETGPTGEARGEGTLTGRPWAWSSWKGVTHRGTVDEHVDVAFTREGVVITTEVRDTSRAAVPIRHRFVKAACSTIADDPIETLKP